MAGVWGEERVGVRLSPGNPFNDMADSDPAATFSHAARELDKLGLAYLHVVMPAPSFVVPGGTMLDARHFRSLWHQRLIVNGGFNRESAAAVVASEAADLVAFAVLFLANPDLPERFRRGAPLNAPDRPTFYGGSAKGYTDYPTLDDAATAAQ